MSQQGGVVVTCLENIEALVRCLGLPGQNLFTLLFSGLLHQCEVVLQACLE